MNRTPTFVFTRFCLRNSERVSSLYFILERDSSFFIFDDFDALPFADFQFPISVQFFLLLTNRIR
ncbi:hypothetical protein CH370_15265 [Leptospira kmetyi]|nr:hypothetical protein CH370_15265 [Leptospira kmetyi]